MCLEGCARALHIGPCEKAPGKRKHLGVPGVGVQRDRFPAFSLLFLALRPGRTGRWQGQSLGGGIGRGGGGGRGGGRRAGPGRVWPRFSLPRNSAALLWRSMNGPGGAAGSGTPPEGSEDPPVLPQDYELAGKNKVVTVDGVKVKLQIWDTAGQERFRSVTHAYYRDAQALLLLYDITSKMSFDNIRAWLTEIHEYAQKDVVIMLLGNKADVSSGRVVRTEDGASLAREYGVPFMETSAKTGMNVELAFLAIAKELKQRSVQPLDEPRFQIHDYIEAQKKKSSCCAFA
ncbi:ras-related protein Rab-37 isoform X4 [Melanerpes formicivorus]|uniref:ras-related protein Rab-37 isoform X4 n=1 Tax=Melanerpes formicivorus TaxID=211600 RepID=UPI00358FBEBE